ncbi:MAG TPA: hypothetical protein VEJ86_09070, partial [Candidatus Binataceae bacterium]|nr:hypothetical protein [Candidatus Binataceae bacterium]
MLLPTTAEHWFALLATLPAYQILLGLLVTGLLFFFVARKLVTTILTLRAIALMPLFSRRLANWVQARNYSYDQFVAADGASARFAEMRKQAVQRLAGYFAAECPKSIAWGDQVRGSFSDLRFTDANRVPFPFAQIMKERFNLCSVVTESNGAKLRDLDGHWTLDVSGSYGLNVAGFD